MPEMNTIGEHGDVSRAALVRHMLAKAEAPPRQTTANHHAAHQHQGLRSADHCYDVPSGRPHYNTSKP